jgi:iron(III) transport system permease protein
VILFLLIVFAPLGALIADLGVSLHAGHGDWPALMLPSGRRLILLARSLGLSFAVATGTMAIGVPAAIYLWRWNTGLPARLRWLVLPLIAVPPYIHALAWSAAAHGFNGFLQSNGIAGIPFQGWSASWWVQLMALTPLAVGLSLMGLEAVEPALIDSARLMATDYRTLKRIVLPLAAPQILAGAGFVFLLSITDYSVPSLFQLNVYSLEIFAEYSATGEPARAFLLAVPLLLITVLILSFSQAALRNTVLKPRRNLSSSLVSLRWPTWLIFCQRGSTVLMAAQIAVPLVMLVTTAGSLHAMAGSVTSARSEILFTFLTAGAVAIASLPIGLAAARKLLRDDRQGRLWWFLVTAPLAVPAPLVGIGLISIWNRPALGAVYGSCFMPVLVSLARFTPLAALALLAHLRGTDPLLFDAARVFHTHALKTWLRVRVPLLLPGLVAACCVVFVLAAGELGATLIVAPPGHATLTMKIYNYLHYGASEAVAGLCLTMAAVALLTGLLIILIVNGDRRPFAKRRR